MPEPIIVQMPAWVFGAIIIFFLLCLLFLFVRLKNANKKLRAQEGKRKEFAERVVSIFEPEENDKRTDEEKSTQLYQATTDYLQIDGKEG